MPPEMVLGKEIVPKSNPNAPTPLVVAELPFDLQVTISDAGEDTVWTPVIGTICVLGDVSPGGSL